MIKWTPQNLNTKILDEISRDKHRITISNVLIPSVNNFSEMKFLYLPKCWLYQPHTHKVGLWKLKEIHLCATGYIVSNITDPTVMVIRLLSVNNSTQMGQCNIVEAITMTEDYNFLVGELD